MSTLKTNGYLLLPKRHNSSMALIAKGSLMIGRKKLVDSQFNEVVVSKTGYELHIPENWK